MNSKKVGILMLFLCAVLMPVLVLVGCGKHNHKFSVWVETKEATCTESGELRRDCLDCDHYETKIIEPLGHNFGDWEFQTEPTCEHNGLKIRKCTRCGVTDTETQEIDKLNHVVFDKYLKDEHNHYRVCLDPDCGEIKSAEPHDFSQGSTCSVCGFSQSMIDAVNFEQIEGKEEYRVAGYKNGAVEEIVIPDEYEGKPVTEIKTQAFCTAYSTDTSPLTTVSIGKNVKKIGTSAFWNCNNLKYLVCPNSLTEIGSYAFSRCGKLETVRFNKNLERIKEESFWGCTSLNEIAFPKSLQTVGNYVFSTCSNLSSVKFNEGLKSLGVSAFWGCENLKNLTLPKTLQSIGNSAFYNCTGLTDLNMQGNNMVVDAYAFYGCTSLKNIDFGGVKTIGQQAFDGCIGLTELTFPDGLEEVGYFTFYNCSNIENINFGKIKIIGESAFNGCSSLKNVVLPDSVKKVKDLAFYNCTDLTSVDLGDGYLEVEDFVFNECTSLKTVRVGDNIQSFGSEVFVYEDNGQTKELDMNYYDGGDQMKYIGNENNHFLIALKAEDTISTYTAKSGTRIIAGHAFSGISYSGCDLLTEVNLNNVVTISRYGFAYCSNLETVRFGESLKVIKERAFALDSNIKKVYAPSLEAWMKIFYDFSNVADEEVQYQGDANPIYHSGNLYINNSDQPLTELVVPESITEIFSCSFAECKGLKSIKIHKNVTKINDAAFLGCTEVTSIEVDDQNSVYRSEQNSLIEKSSDTLLLGCKESVIPNGVVHIAPFAFNNIAISSRQVEIPDSVLTIGKNAFNYTKLSKFTMGVNVQSIGRDAFGKDSEDPQRDVYIKDLEKWFDIDFENENANPVAWGSQIYYNGKQLTNGFSEGLIIPESVTEIKKWAFANASVHDISIHSGVTKIDPTAFARVANLQRITLDEDNKVYSLTENKKGVVYTDSKDKNVLLMSTTGDTLDFSNDNIQIIGDYAFANRGLDYIILPETVETIGNYAFQYCDIIEITIPATVTRLGNGAFNNCYYLNSVTFNDSNNWYEVEVDESEEDATPVDFSTPSANATKFKPTYSAFIKK